MSQNAPATGSASAVLAPFQWEDPFPLDSQLSDEERSIRDVARDYCQTKLLPRVLTANREERFDREILNEMGALGMKDMTPERVLEYKIHGVTPEYAKAMAQVGYADLTPERLLEFKIHGVQPEYVHAMVNSSIFSAGKCG